MPSSHAWRSGALATVVVAEAVLRDADLDAVAGDLDGVGVQGAPGGIDADAGPQVELPQVTHAHQYAGIRVEVPVGEQHLLVGAQPLIGPDLAARQAHQQDMLTGHLDVEDGTFPQLAEVRRVLPADGNAGDAAPLRLAHAYTTSSTSRGERPDSATVASSARNSPWRRTRIGLSCAATRRPTTWCAIFSATTVIGSSVSTGTRSTTKSPSKIPCTGNSAIVRPSRSPQPGPAAPRRSWWRPGRIPRGTSPYRRARRRGPAAGSARRGSGRSGP